MKHLLLGLTWILLVATGAAASDAGRLYLPLDDAMGAVDRTLLKARENNKRALIIMGANWCHDSRALASNLQAPELAAPVSEAFEIQYVDVGFLEKNFDINRRFGLPVIFGTPTVLAIDPETQQLVNRDSLHIWSNAASFSKDETLERLAVLANPTAQAASPPADTSEVLAMLLAQIDTFERQQAERIYGGFAVVGPMLAAYMKGEKPENFDSYWRQLHTMRSQLPKDLIRLREQAELIVASGKEEAQLQIPAYPLFDWEKPSETN
ncbi:MULTISPECIES: thioredoxin family protein [Microbulbifer]|nr:MULTISPECIES: thioredoxin family protein [Microbulbifer]